MLDDGAPVVYTPIYTTYDDLTRLYASNKLTVKIGDEESDDLAPDAVLLFIRDAERWLTAQLSKRYSVPVTVTAGSTAADTLAQVALYKAGYLLWISMAGVQYQGEGIPPAVIEWGKQSEALAAELVAGTIPLSGQTSRSASRTPLYETRAHIYNQVRGESETIDDDEVSTSVAAITDDGDILDGTGE